MAACATVAQRIARELGRPVRATRPLAGGCVGEVLLVEFTDGGRLVAKLGPGLEPEGWMLKELAARSRLPVPRLVHADDDLLLMEWVEAGGTLDTSAQEHAAELLADLHGLTWRAYGLERDTLIGGLAQPNPPTARWLDFFRDHRLLYMADQAHRAGRLPAATLAGVERLAARLERWIDEPAAPGLIHGDCWGGNMLCRAGRVAAFHRPRHLLRRPGNRAGLRHPVRRFRPGVLPPLRRAPPLKPGLLRGSPRLLQPLPAAGPRPPVRRRVCRPGGADPAATGGVRRRYCE